MAAKSATLGINSLIASVAGGIYKLSLFFLGSSSTPSSPILFINPFSLSSKVLGLEIFLDALLLTILSSLFLNFT